MDLDLDLDLRIRDLDLDLDLAIAGLVTSLVILVFSVLSTRRNLHLKWTIYKHDVKNAML